MPDSGAFHSVRHQEWTLVHLCKKVSHGLPIVHGGIHLALGREFLPPLGALPLPMRVANRVPITGATRREMGTTLILEQMGMEREYLRARLCSPGHPST